MVQHMTICSTKKMITHIVQIDLLILKCYSGQHSLITLEIANSDVRGHCFSSVFVVIIFCDIYFLKLLGGL